MDKIKNLKKELARDRGGFTLIEMLVVIAVIGILASVIVVGLGGAREGSRDARRVADIRQIQNALELRFDNSNGYESPVADCTNATGNTGVAQEEGSSECFLEPDGLNPYEYEPLDSDGDGFNESYALGACLETGDNANASTGDADCPTSLDCSGGAGDWAFCQSP